MIDTKHTPTPWRLAGETYRDYEGDVIKSGGKHIAAIITEDAVEVEEEDRANARHIIRCVNVHDELVAMLKIAIATSNPAKHKWMKEARDAIAEATGQPFDAKEAEAARHMHQAAGRMFAALEKCEKTVREFHEHMLYVDEFLHHQDEARLKEIEDVRREAFAALCEARGEIAF